MWKNTQKIREVYGCKPDAIPESIHRSQEPLVLRGLVKDWPIVEASLRSDNDAINYLKKFYTDKTVGTFLASPDIKGRFFYNDDLTALNFESRKLPLDVVLDKILEHSEDSQPPAIYVGSTTVDTCLPGFRNNNDLKIADYNPMVSIWMGNPSRIPCHYDGPDNLACVVTGKRRFTLFAPEQIINLYPGPIDFTPAGQTVSLVDFVNPDLEKYPNFVHAMEAAVVAELEPGDAIFIPSLWWHHIEALDKFNVLVNYWWRPVPAFVGAGIDVIRHAILNIRDLPEKEKIAWKVLFDYYIFGDPTLVTNHIPENAQGFLAELDEAAARQLRTLLINRLNR
jgi:hypothetical protein